MNMKKRVFIRLTALLCVTALLLSGAGAGHVLAAKKKKPALNKTHARIAVGKKVKLKLKNSRKKVKWSSSNKKVATVSKKGLVKGKKKGKAKIIARSAGKKYVCHLVVGPKSSEGGGTNPNLDVSPQPGSSASPGSSSQPGSTAKPGSTAAPSPSADPGTTSTIVEDMPASPADSITVGKMQVTLGMSKGQVEGSIGQPIRQEKSPQGFDTFVYNPSNDYRNYMLVHFSGDQVVGMSTISRYFSYESLVFAGDDASTLKGKGFENLGEGYNAAYKYNTGSAIVIAYIDFQGDGGTYGVQVFNAQYDLDDVLYPQKCNYTSESVSAVITQMPELANAFRRYKGIKLLCSVKGNTAQQHSDKMVAAGDLGNISSTDPDGTVLIDRMDAAYGYVMGWGENNGSGSADAFGYISFWIDDTTADKAAGTNYTKPYNNLVETVDGDGYALSAYYVCAGLSFDVGKKSYVTYATMDFYFY